MRFRKSVLAQPNAGWCRNDPRKTRERGSIVLILLNQIPSFAANRGRVNGESAALLSLASSSGAAASVRSPAHKAHPLAGRASPPHHLIPTSRVRTPAVPPSSAHAHRACEWCARRGRRVLPMRPATGGNGPGHGREWPRQPRRAPVRRGRGRTQDLSNGAWRRRLLCFAGVAVVGRVGLVCLAGRLAACFVDGAQVGRGHLAAAVGLEVIADALIFAQRAHPGTLDGGDVDERVVSALVRLDEAVALVFIEEFDDAGGHNLFLCAGGPKVPDRFLLEVREEGKRSRKAP